MAIDTTLASDNHLCFRKNLLEKILKLIMMTIACKIEDEKLQDYINWETAKLSALWSGTVNKHEYLTRQ